MCATPRMAWVPLHSFVPGRGRLPVWPLLLTSPVPSSTMTVDVRGCIRAVRRPMTQSPFVHGTGRPVVDALSSML